MWPKSGRWPARRARCLTTRPCCAACACWATWSSDLAERAPVVLFLHIPKTAGVTLNAILDREYGRGSIYTFQRGRSYLAASIAHFRGLPDGVRNGYLVLRGHVPFGMHAWLEGPSIYISLVRQPVARAISHYAYVLARPDHLLHAQVAAGRMSLLEYATGGVNLELDNGQVRLLSGVGDAAGFGEVGEDQLRQALSNLEGHFALAGLTERFDEAALLLSHKLDWQRLPLYAPRNVASRRRPRPAVEAATRRAIQAANALDSRLYEAVKERFEREAARLTAAEKTRFARLNRAYRPLGQLLDLLGRLQPRP
ncbi:MAG: hypothetical protein ACRDHL_04320 [Candidatus Promineifilaceae bacterium]